MFVTQRYPHQNSGSILNEGFQTLVLIVQNFNVSLLLNVYCGVFFFLPKPNQTLTIEMADQVKKNKTIFVVKILRLFPTSSLHMEIFPYLQNYQLCLTADIFCITAFLLSIYAVKNDSKNKLYKLVPLDLHLK